MRLLQLMDDGNIEFTEYVGKDAPPYAILSHRWGDAGDEVSYADVVEGCHRSKVGYANIRSCGKQAKKDGLTHFWVDTCCINKESSAELSEAINSMYAWYQNADICYAYLSDVRDSEEYGDSAWFERGWTLQELLAPADVLFFNTAWIPIGFKTSLSLSISQRTGIRESVLLDGSAMNEYSVAERMSRAANRQTSRVEDEAYCLLGLFDVSMPLIYGEGRQAFLRLQEELLRRSDDVSVFAYFSNPPSAPAGPSTLRVAVREGDLTVIESNDSGVVANTDEEPWLGTVGLYAPSPAYFCGTAKYAPYPMIHRMVKHHHLPIQARLRVRRWGHRIKLEAVLWKVPVEELSADWRTSDASVQAIILEIHGVELSLMGIQKLRKCSQAVDMSNWYVAFLDCCNLDGGIVGILLRESVDPKVYIRQHFPSIIETKHAKPFRDLNKVDIRTVHVEADYLKATYTSYTRQTLLQPSSFLKERRAEKGTLLQTINFDKFELKLDGWVGNGIVDPVLYFSSQAAIPHIALIPQESHRRIYSPTSEWSKQGIACILLPLSFSYIKLRKILRSTSWLREWDSVVLPTDRGQMASLKLNDNLQLTLRTQMQWHRNTAWHSYEDIEKRCLLTLTIVELEPKDTASARELRPIPAPVEQHPSQDFDYREFTLVHCKMMT